MFRAGLLITILLPVLSAAQTVAPSPAAPGAKSAVNPGSFVEQIRLGDSVVPLVGPWKFSTGDNPAWSQPGFDDSAWTEMDMTPPTSRAHPNRPLRLPGWTARGFPGYSGYAWYRLTIDVQGSGQPLSLKMPGHDIDDAYQVFVNGIPMGQFGRFNVRSVTAYTTLPRAFPLPADLTAGRMTVAIRFWMDSATPFNSPDAGGLNSPPVLGNARDIAVQVRLDFDDILHMELAAGFWSR